MAGGEGAVARGAAAPGSILADCSADFLRAFHVADLIIAKGQDNFETLSDEPRTIYFLFKAKCPVIASHAGVEQGALVLLHPRRMPKI